MKTVYYKSWAIKESVLQDYYAISSKNSRTFMGNTIQEIKIKIDKHLDSINKSTPSTMFPLLNKALKRLSK